MRKYRLKGAGEFDQANLTCAFNTVVMSRKWHAAGWPSFNVARLCLLDLPSSSRVRDPQGPRRARLACELVALKCLWATDRTYDPFHRSELSRLTLLFTDTAVPDLPVGIERKRPRRFTR